MSYHLEIVTARCRCPQMGCANRGAGFSLSNLEDALDIVNMIAKVTNPATTSALDGNTSTNHNATNEAVELADDSEED